jgi:hypothetical protein
MSRSVTLYSEINEYGTSLKEFTGNFLVLVANTRKTAVRIADIPPGVAAFSKEEQWKTVQEHFPIGEKMNESTHVFDGSVFTNSNGQSRLFMAALPVNICEKFAKTGEEITGSVYKIKRMDTAEHILFRKYTNAAKPDDSVFIFLPQENALRILHIAENLPNATFLISNNPTYREDEFFLFYNSIEEKPVKKAIFVNHCPTADFEWLHVLLSRKSFIITEDSFM